MSSTSKKASNKDRRSRKAPAVATSRRVVIEFPEALYQETEKAVAELETNRSSLIREAVETYLQALYNRNLERELIEGYIANSQQARDASEAFAHVDTDIH